MKFLLGGVERSVSRPYVSNDNPFSEALFKTFKYAPSYPERFGSYEDGLEWCRAFFPWYSEQHRHSEIAYLTPASVHEGRGEAILVQRHATMLAAYKATPERFPNGPPRCATLPEAVWINPPEDRSQFDICLANARKESLPGVSDEITTGSRIAAGDERSELEAVVSSTHSEVINTIST